MTLNEGGHILLIGEIDSDLAKDVIKEIIKLNQRYTMLNSKSILNSLLNINLLERDDFTNLNAIHLIIDSAGGSVNDAFTIIDIMRKSKLPVYTYGSGFVCSAALLIFCAGKNGKRFISKNASILAHRFSWEISGSHKHLKSQAKEIDYLHEKMVKHLIRNSNLNTTKQIEENILKEDDNWMTPREAIKFGLADKLF